MKKLLGILVLGLLLSSNVEAASYVFSENKRKDCDILTKNDPTTLKTLTFLSKQKLLAFDGRSESSRRANFFLFNAVFEKGNAISIRVNSEFKTKDKAEEQALKYGRMAGQLPNFLRTSVQNITIHRGQPTWRAGLDTYNIIIHTNRYGTSASRTPRKCVEEVMLHESSHISLDRALGSVWKKLIKADGKFISSYAKKYPDREDIAETVLWWVAVRCKTDRISKKNYKKILKYIPNRLRYLDEQDYDLYPLVCK